MESTHINTLENQDNRMDLGPVSVYTQGERPQGRDNDKWTFAWTMTIKSYIIKFDV